jgi:hypothetical protein
VPAVCPEFTFAAAGSTFAGSDFAFPGPGFDAPGGAPSGELFDGGGWLDACWAEISAPAIRRRIARIDGSGNVMAGFSLGETRASFHCREEES